MGERWLDELDPRVRVLCGLMLAVALVATQSLPVTLLVCVPVVGAIASTGRDARSCLSFCAPMLPVAVLVFGLQAVIGGARRIGPLALSEPGMLLGAVFAVRILALAAIAWLVTARTSASRLAAGIGWLLAPLRLIRVPVAELARAIAIALEHVPALQRRQRLLDEAWAARALPQPRGPIARLAHRRRLLMPLLTSAFRTAHDLDDAMRMRGLNAHTARSPVPTAYRPMRIDGTDMVALAVCTAVALVSIVR